jgi:hypothetical protein
MPPGGARLRALVCDSDPRGVRALTAVLRAVAIEVHEAAAAALRRAERRYLHTDHGFAYRLLEPPSGRDASRRLRLVPYASGQVPGSRHDAMEPKGRSDRSVGARDCRATRAPYR